MYRLWVFLHLAGVFGFLLAHGVSAAVALRLRKERDAERVKTLLDLSGTTISLMYVSLIVLIGAGILAGFVGHWWGDGWIWAAIGVLVLMLLSMWALASPYYGRLREAVGLPSSRDRRRGAEPKAPLPSDQLQGVLRAPQPLVISAIGFLGLLVILWLMVLKPF